MSFEKELVELIWKHNRKEITDIALKAVESKANSVADEVLEKMRKDGTSLGLDSWICDRLKKGLTVKINKALETKMVDDVIQGVIEQYAKKDK